MLKAKSSKSYRWLPSQVVYGVDTSDSDPDKWVPFGELAEKAAEEKQKHGPKPATPPDR